MALMPATCTPRSEECLHTSCSSCMTFSGGSFPFGPLRFPTRRSRCQTPFLKIFYIGFYLIFLLLVGFKNETRKKVIKFEV